MAFTNIAVFPNKDKQEGDNKPDLRLVASYKEEGSDEFKSVTVGSLWKKDSKNGKFYSGKMSDAFTTKDGKEFPGFVINRDDAPAGDGGNFDDEETSAEQSVAEAFGKD